MNKPNLINRRQLTIGAATTGIMFVTGTVSSAVVAQEWQAADPLRFAGPVSGLPSLDPALSRELQANYWLAQIYRGLVSLDSDLNPVPELAETVNVLDDGQRYRFTMRENARFQNGEPIRAAEAIASLNRALNPAIANGDPSAIAARTYIGDIQGADEVVFGGAETLTGLVPIDDLSFDIILVAPSQTFLARLANVTTAIVDVKQIAADRGWMASPNGSGPYSVANWNSSEQLSLTAAPTWWAGDAPIHDASVRLGSSAIGSLYLYQSDEIDVIPSMIRQDVALAKDPASGVTWGEFLETTLFATAYIAFGNTTPPLDDPHIRRALQRVFPVDQFAEGQFGDVVTQATGLVPPGMLGAAWLAEVPPVDLEAAREEIRLSRYKRADAVPTIEIYAADIAPVAALAEVAADELGLDVRALEVPFPEFIQGLVERRYGAYSIYWGADYPDPESMLGMLFGATSPDNYTGYNSPEFEDLLQSARTETGPERIATLEAANQHLVDDAAVIAIYYPRGFTLVREGLAPVEVTPLGIRGLETMRGAS